MGQAVTNPVVTDLTPELEAKLWKIEREVAEIQGAAHRKRRWYWFGLLPRLVQVLAVLSIFGYLVGAVLQSYAFAHDLKGRADIWLIVFRFVGGVAGSLLTLLLATWANRYCEARGDGKI